ncbi:bile salt-activated lipase-like [Battus philenor]|uniref:bile salt-activated lipase-like n=1 Tax=Battus philenor TaxID=42288 RepID=UPI0035D0F810
MQVLALMLLFTCGVSTSWAPDLVTTKKGIVRGVKASDGDYSMFLGIPYGRVNISNPFGTSLPFPDFDDIFEATKDSAPCPQIDDITFLPTGTLDCLHLNIYVPNKASISHPLPVVFWIHGGGFQLGHAGRQVYGPRYLIQHDVILITVNYRVGAYGFMCLDTPEVPGNQGLKDQLRALRWVHENIGAFGGDANKITIFGESAGGASVDFHLLYSDKVFDKAIMQSGSTLGPWSIIESDRNAPIEIANSLGLKTKDLDEALNFLTTVEPKRFIEASLFLSFMPCVEKKFQGVEIFISEHPVTVIPESKNISILCGYNNHEMLLMYINRPDHLYPNAFKKHLPMAFHVEEQMEKLVRQFYIGDEGITENVKYKLVDFESDFLFNYPVYRSMQKYINKEKVYHYIFSYSGGRNFLKSRTNVTEGGAVHADELGYLFDVSFLAEPTREDQLMIDRITKMWTDFVKHGDPTPQTSDLVPVKWIPATENTLHYLNIDNQLTLKKRPFHQRMAFWELFYQTYRHLEKGQNMD